MTRRRFTERQTIACLIQQGAVIPCKRCRLAFTAEDATSVEREHDHELALGGEDSIANCFYSHKDCHDAITNGIATTAGSSKNRIAKANNEARREKFVIRKLPVDEPRAEEVIEPRCRRCGEYPETCACTRPQKHRGFGRAFA